MRYVYLDMEAQYGITKEKVNEGISAFAFRMGKEIERWIEERNDNLNDRVQILEAKILTWYSKHRDDVEFADYFGLESKTKGNI